MRNTIQKDIVKNALSSLGNHPNADEVYEHIHKENPSISKATVYRILGNMAQTGNALRLVCPQNADRFDHRLDNHYHIKCEKCNRIFDVDLPYMDYIDKEVSKSFSVSSHQIIFLGLCKDCEK